MASHTVSGTDKAVWEKALAAATVDTVTFSRDAGSVRVYLDAGTTAIYFTVDGSVPAVGGNSAYRVRATAGEWTEVDVPGSTGPGSVVKLISSGACTYSVEGST